MPLRHIPVTYMHYQARCNCFISRANLLKLLLLREWLQRHLQGLRRICKRCKNKILLPIQLPNYLVSEIEETVQLNTHTCFPGCKTTADCLVGYDIDTRPPCGGNLTLNSGAWCVMPSNSTCETLLESGQKCFDKEGKICLNYLFMIYSIIIMNVLQVFFEGSLLYAVEATWRPTNLEKLSQPDIFGGGEDDQAD